MKRKHENIAWAAAWALVFTLIPLTMLSQLLSERPAPAMHHVLSLWIGILPFFVLFLIHHFLLLPLFKKRVPLYLCLTGGLLVVFGLFCFLSRMPSGPPPGLQGVPGPPPEPIGGHAPIRPDVMNIFMGILLVGADLGVFFYLESLRSERRVEELQAESVSRQLETLRYQINPHFFMNTLNNIHALVDIDPEKAKESIEEFSKIMRIVLYEGNESTIPLSKEIDFIEHYISLMRLRYPEDIVRIEAFFPAEYEGAVVPPLLMASFVENAFKHGISYDAQSFVRVRIDLKQGRIFFRCVNSDHPASDSESKGLGLDNIRQRLTLQYGEDYSLQADARGSAYEVLLIIPYTPTT